MTKTTPLLIPINQKGGGLNLNSHFSDVNFKLYIPICVHVANDSRDKYDVYFGGCLHVSFKRIVHIRKLE